MTNPVACNECGKRYREMKYGGAKLYYCNSCQIAFVLCDACKNDGYSNWEKPKRRTNYCPECNKKPESIKVEMDAATSPC